jgi:hypothetical protein
MSNMAGVLLLEAETAYPSRAHGVLMGYVLLIFLDFGGVRVAHLFSFWWGTCCSSF